MQLHNKLMDTYYQEIIAWIKENKPSKDKIALKKIALCKLHKRKKIPTDIEVFLHAKEEDIPLIRPYLKTKPTRTGSGVAVVATMTAPYVCPHGSCTYCPGGPNSAYGDTPKSYTGKEPSTMRGMRNDYDAYRIVFNRLEQYIVIGQNPDKVEQIVMGGTFPAMPEKYQYDYIYYSYKAYNDFSKLFYKDNKLDLKSFKAFFELPGSVHDNKRAESIKQKILDLREKDIKSLEEEQTINETAAIRCIGLTIETKPDWGFKEHGLRMLEFGTTRVELGIQTTYDEILQATNRGHDIQDSKKSIAELRDLGFKLNFHMMPGQPDMSGKRISEGKDLASLKEIFDNDAYKPDMLKIYPCMVMPKTALENDFKAGIFRPLETKEAAQIIAKARQYFPEYCRVMRVQRDIPTYATTAGVNRTNLRQYVDKIADELNIKCKCIRCREIKDNVLTQEPQLIVREYTAADGKEFFISSEADNKILGFVRLRFPPRFLHNVITKESALIRELHVYGSAVAIGNQDNKKTQHKGIGKKLMQKAEEITIKHNKNKIIVISGVGVRGYYRKIGYHKEGPYMVKNI